MNKISWLTALRAKWAFVAFLLPLAIAVLGCSKKDDDEKPGDIIKPVIQLSSPLIHQHYFKGDTIFFRGLAVDDAKLANVVVFIHLEDDPGLQFEQTFSPNSKSFEILTYFVVTTDEQGIEYFFQAKTTDNSGNSAETDEKNHVHINS